MTSFLPRWFRCPGLLRGRGSGFLVVTGLLVSCSAPPPTAPPSPLPREGRYGSETLPPNPAPEGVFCDVYGTVVTEIPPEACR